MSERDQRWTIRFDDFQPDDERRREALLALGNGLLSWRASAPEAAFTQQASSPHYAGFYRAGWYDHAERVVNGETVRLAALVNLPDPFGLAISLDGQQWFDAAQLAQSDYRQCLRMDRAQLERELSFVLGESRCRLREVRLLSLADPDLALLRWELEVPAGIERVWVRTLLDGGVRNQLVEKNRAYEGARLCEVRMQADEAGRVGLSARVATPGRRLAMAVQTHCDAAGLRWRTRQEQSRVVQMAECGLDGTRRLVIEKRVVVQVDDALVEPPEAAIRQVLARLPGERFWLLHLRHARAWRRLWTRMPLALGDPPLERALRLHAFHLLQTISPQSLGHDIGFPPRGWQEGYFGQVFWDEVFAFAFLGMHFPALARQLLRYRHRHLDGARERARQAGLRGAMFPWRSADDGQEQTPPYQCNPLSGRWMADHTYRQRHIGAAIAHDAWQLYLATGDETLLANEAGELIL